MQHSVSFSFDAIGTHWVIELYGSQFSGRHRDLEEQVKSRINTFEKTYSRFDRDSFVSKLGHTAGTFRLPVDAPVLFKLYKHLYDATDGAFTPLIGETLHDAGYDRQYSLQPKKLHIPPAWDEVMSVHDRTLELKRPVHLDFGAAGKGYLIDIVDSLLQSNGVTQFSIDAGQDIIYHNNHKPFRVGLEHPLDTSQVIGVATITDGSICGSSGNRRQWGRFHHIIHPQTLTSPHEIIAVWVYAKKAIIADALSTCLYLVPDQVLSSIDQFEYCILYKDLSIKKTPHFPAEFF